MIINLTLYILSLLGILIYSIYQFNLARLYRSKRVRSRVTPEVSEWPKVTIQLPIYNEKYVVKRLLECIAEFDYPQDKLQIQILDDSDDDTIEIIDKALVELDIKFSVDLVRRTDRVGFKAGALKEGLKTATGEFIAIFDSDFLPKKEFLKKSIPYFQNKEIGVVQTRWGFVNRDYSVLTSLQAFALDTHFTIEQAGRNFDDHFINFNGTAGIWRKECIFDAGNWEANTLTEDLDLSYRAQMKGWKFQYLQEERTPSELPVTILALKKQQFRWNKGGAQCFRKHLSHLFGKKDMRFSDRVHGIFHLMNSSIYVFILLSLITSTPIVFVLKNHPELHPYVFFSSIFVVANFLLMYVYWTSYSSTHELKFSSFLLFLPKFFLFLVFSFGLTIHNTIAVLEGWFGVKSPFIRTPKFNIMDEDSAWNENNYVEGEFGFVEIMEFLFGLFFLVIFYFDITFGAIYLAVFHLGVATGFFIISFYSFNLWRKFQFSKNKKVVSLKD